MPTDILISSDPWENRVAVLEDGQLAEIYFEREERVIGSIYKGKVMNVLPGMGASFVDIGLGRNAFLYVDDINKTPLNIGDVEITQGRSGYSISEKVERGEDVLVQIVKEPRGLKGARISTNISLPGRYLILMPTGKYSGVSRKIESAEERNRLKAIMKLIRPEGMATVVRTAAAGVSQAELIADLGVLIRMWHGILESYKRAAAPALIHKDMNLVYKAARDFITPEVNRVLIDDAEEYEKVRDFMRLLGPQYVDRIGHYNSGRSLFKDFKVDEEVQKLLRPKVNLPSGGSIVIESTEALTVIDVNSGKFTGGRNLEDTIVKTNVEAAAEIARQVRLRDIGGIIVCDFIDMSSEGARNKVIATLEGGLRKDRTRTTIQSFSALGLLEFTRKRVGKDLSAQLRAPCPTCNGLGGVMSPETVAIETLRDVRRFDHDHFNGKGKHHPVEVILAPTVGAQLDYWYQDELHALEEELQTKIAVRVDLALHPERTRLVLLDDDKDVTAPPQNVRVGDEIEVDLLNVRVPVATSALAVVGDRLVEVENAAGAIGQSVKIKVLDIDEDGTILAEPRTPLAAAAVDGKKRRRRGGRVRRKELTPAEQEEQLRELAEEAARGLGGRPALGISTSAEAEAEDAVERAHPAAAPPLATVTPLRSVPDFAQATPGEERVYATYGGDEGRRRRRRRRRRRTGADVAAVAALAGIPPGSLEVQAEAEHPEALITQARIRPMPPAEGAAVAGDAAPGEEVRRKRRRRRRRGRGGFETAAIAAAPSAGDAGAERTVFRVAPDGGAARIGPPGRRPPGRAIAPLELKPSPVAVEPPPPSLSAPAEPVHVARPTRGRRPRVAATALETPAQAAGPPPAVEPSPAREEEPAPKRRAPGRRAPTAATTPAVTTAEPPPAPPAPSVAASPKRRAARKAAESAPPAPTVAARTAPKRKTAAAALKPASTATAKAAKTRTSATAKKSAAKKSSAKKTATTRKKKGS